MIKCEKISKCRVCGGKDLQPAINLGDQYLSSVFPSDLSYRETEKKYSLNSVMCQNCGLIQLDSSLQLDSMYALYPYRSNLGHMKTALKDVVDSVVEYIKPDENDLVCDVGGNDLTTLSFFEEFNCNMMCIDAAQCEPVFSHPKLKNIQGTYFNKETFFANSDKKANIFLMLAMFYHLDQPVAILKDVEECLDHDGICVIQMAYLLAELKGTLIDNRVHEHAAYYTLSSLKKAVDQTGLEIFDVTQNNLYSGSFRIFLKKKDCLKYSINKRVWERLEDEARFGTQYLQTYKDFENNWEKTGKKIKRIIRRYNNVWILAAPTKFSTVLQNLELTNKDITAAAEIFDWKIGKLIIGCDIPIKSESDMRESKPDLIVIGLYGFWKEILKKNLDLIEDGADVLVPLPEPRIINKNNYKEYLE